MKEKIGNLWILLTLLASLLPSQTWRGDEAVAVQVNDSKGRSVTNARVVFTFQGIPGETGPDVVATNDNGRAVLADLVPGPWQVEVSHPDYLSATMRQLAIVLELDLTLTQCDSAVYLQLAVRR